MRIRLSHPGSRHARRRSAEGGDPLGARLESFMLLLKRKGGFA
jgi:hypothetical protein